MPASVGRYFGGHQYCVIGASGTRITSTSPASQQINYTYPATPYAGAVTENVWHNGMWQVTSLAGLYDGTSGEGPPDQPFDGRTQNYGGNGPMPYEHTDNKNPGATGSALTISAPCVVIQAKSRDNADLVANEGRQFLDRRDALFFVSSAPATDSLPPPIGASSLVPRYTKADIDLTAFPTHAAIPGGEAAETLLNNIRWLSNTEWSARPRGDYYAGRVYEPSYATNQASLYAGVALALCTNISSTTRELLAAHVIIHAQNTIEALEAGARYNYQGGLGGILAGRKIFVVLAYIITGDAYFGDWAVRTDWAAEDRQVRHVTAGDVTTYDYISADEGMPDWNANWVNATGSITRVTPKSTYQNIFCIHNIAQALAVMMVTGAKAAWNNDAFFDYADRIMERTLYDGSGTNQWARTLTGTNSPSTYAKAFWDAHRSDGGMPAIWNW